MKIALFLVSIFVTICGKGENDVTENLELHLQEESYYREGLTQKEMDSFKSIWMDSRVKRKFINH